MARKLKKGLPDHCFSAGMLADLEEMKHPYSKTTELNGDDILSGKYNSVRWNKGKEVHPFKAEDHEPMIFRAIGAASQRGPSRAPEVGGKVKKTPMPTGGRAPRPERVPGVKAAPAVGNAMQIVPLNKYKPPPFDLDELSNALATTKGALTMFAKKFKNKEEFATHMQRHQDTAGFIKKHGMGTPKLHRLWKQLTDLDKNQP